MDHFIDHGIIIESAAGKETTRAKCPKCTPERKNQSKRDLVVDLVKMVWYCHHCGWKGALKGYSHPAEWKPKYRRPDPPQQTEVVDKWRQWFNGRGISDEVMARNRIITSDKAVGFCYYRADELITIKYRTLDKKFWSEKDTEHIVYGYDDIKIGAGSYLVWVEGEMDKLSVEMAGVTACVSVPDGAPNASAKDVKQKFTFLDSLDDVLGEVEKHVIAVDSDANGMRLREELVRRLGAEKCYIVKWPDGCKDANDVLLKHGSAGLLRYLEAATPAPIKGVITAADIVDEIENDYHNGVPRGLSTGWRGVDSLYTVRPGEWTVVTGIPGHGKSEFLDALQMNMAMAHGWQFAVCSPENQPVKLHAIKLIEKYIGKPFDQRIAGHMTSEDVRRGVDFIDRHFHFLAMEEFTIDKILTAAKSLIVQRGINGLIIDPWNEIEGDRKQGQTETEYICVALGRFRRFARENQVHLWIVAHPTKLPKERTEYRGKERSTKNFYAPPTLYDISGSSHWRNKADNGICIYRNMDTGFVDVHVQKIRFKEIGRVGMTSLSYDIRCGRYRDQRPNYNEGGNDELS